MRCRFRAYGDDKFLAEHDEEVVDKNDFSAIERIRDIAFAKGEAALAGKAVRVFRVEGPEFL